MSGRGRGRGAVLPAWMKNQEQAAPGSAAQPAANPQPVRTEEVGSKRAWDAPDRGAAPAPKRPVPADPELAPGWEESYDSVKWHRAYWYNRATGERTWVKPKKTDVPAAAAAAAPAAAPAAAQGGQWESAEDPGSGRTYYFNRATQERVWKLPAGATLKAAAAPAAAKTGGGEAEEGEVASRPAPASKATSQTASASEGAAPASAAAPELPPGWRSAVDASGREYFYSNELNITQWHRPAAVAPAPVAPAAAAARPRGREAPLDPMDPAAYSDAPRGGWGAGLGADQE